MSTFPGETKDIIAYKVTQLLHHYELGTGTDEVSCRYCTDCSITQ